MICPQHDTHIDECVHDLHNVHDSWEIRIPIRTDSGSVTILAMKLQAALEKHLFENGESHRIGHVPINIGVQGDGRK